MNKYLLQIGFVFMVLAGCYFLYKAFTVKKETEYVYSGVAPSGNTQKLPTKGAVKEATFKHFDANTISSKDIRDPEKPLGLIDSTAALLEIARKEIISVREQLSTTEAKLLKASKKINELNQTVYYYKDKYVDISYTASTDTTQEGTFDFTYRSRVTVTDYTQRDKILGLKIGAKRSYTNITSEDPRTTINGLRSLQLERQEPFFGLKGQAVGGYNFATNTVGLGAGIRIDLGRLSLQGNYLFYPDASTWRPSVNANYDLIRL